MKKKLLALLVVLAMVLAIVPAVHAEGKSMSVKVTPSVSTAKVGDTVDYTVYATGEGVASMQFNLEVPAGLSYVAGSAKIPSDLKGALGWFVLDWTEGSMMWTGANDVVATFPADTVILTFSCKVTAEGEHSVNLTGLKPFDENYKEFAPELSVGKVTVAADVPVTEPTTTETTPDPVPGDKSMNVVVKASASEVKVGDTIGYTVYATGAGVASMQFNLDVPAGLTYVPGSAKIPSDLKGALGWFVLDWTESSMMWTGANDVVATFPTDTVILTFSCSAAAEGNYKVDLTGLKPFDENYKEFPAVLSVDTVSVIPAPCQHVFDNYVSNNNATCTVDGTKTAECANGCGAKDTIADVGTALGHSFINYVSNNDATCTVDGTKTAECENGCGAIDIADDAGSAIGHKFTNYVSDNNATCTKDGTKTAVCDNGCGAKDVVTEAGTALGHKFTNYVSNNDATCTENGTKTAVCDNGCGAKDTVADEGSALNHGLKLVEAKDATCTEDGNAAYYVCEKCSAMFEDATGSKPTNKDAVKVAAPGHVDEDGDKICDVCQHDGNEPEPTEPTTQPTEPTTQPTTKPTTKPGNGEEIPKTDNNGMMIYFAVMMAAAFAVLFTVLLGKKKYMA